MPNQFRVFPMVIHVFACVFFVQAWGGMASAVFSPVPVRSTPGDFLASEPKKTGTEWRIALAPELISRRYGESTLGDEEPYVKKDWNVRSLSGCKRNLPFTKRKHVVEADDARNPDRSALVLTAYRRRCPRTFAYMPPRPVTRPEAPGSGTPAPAPGRADRRGPRQKP